MRILSYLLLSIFIVSFTSCSSDDDNNDQENLILGEWDASKFTMEGTFIIEGNSVSFDGVANDLSGNDITFHQDNTVTGNSAPFDMELNYVINGMPITMTQTMSSVMVHSGTWRKEGGFLYFKEAGSDEEVEYIIQTLNNSTLKITADQDNIDVGSDFPPGGQFRVTITYNR